MVKRRMPETATSATAVATPREEPLLSWNDLKESLNAAASGDFPSMLPAATVPRVDSSSDEELQAERIHLLLKQEIQKEQAACSLECASLHELQCQVEEQQALLQDLSQNLEQIQDSLEHTKESIWRFRQEKKSVSIEADKIEAERMLVVPKLKHQISLYARATGIKWEYDKQPWLAGQVAIPSRDVISRFAMDPRDYDDFQIANYLWSAMEGEVPRMIAQQ